jgi:hypothetical protein
MLNLKKLASSTIIVLVTSFSSINGDVTSNAMTFESPHTVVKSFATPLSAIRAVAIAIKAKTGVECLGFPIGDPMTPDNTSVGYVGELRCENYYSGLPIGKGKSWAVRCRPSIYSDEDAVYRLGTPVYPVLNGQLFMTFDSESNMLMEGSKCTKALQKFVGSKDLPGIASPPPMKVLADKFFGSSPTLFRKTSVPNPKLPKNSYSYSYVRKQQGKCLAVFVRTQAEAKYYQQKRKTYKYGTYLKVVGQELEMWIVTDQQMKSSKCTADIRVYAGFAYW